MSDLENVERGAWIISAAGQIYTCSVMGSAETLEQARALCHGYLDYLDLAPATEAEVAAIRAKLADMLKRTVVLRPTPEPIKYT